MMLDQHVIWHLGTEQETFFAKICHINSGIKYSVFVETVLERCRFDL